MRRRRPAVQYAPLTSLLDVLFIIVFAALVQASAVRRAPADDGATARPAPPAAAATIPAEAAELHRRAVATLEADLRDRRPVIARIAADGTLRAIEADGEVVALGLPLVERDPDPDVALRYLGDRSAELRLCALVALRLGRADLGDALVVIAPDAPLAELTVALVGGLRRDVERCAADRHGLAVIVEPAVAAAAGDAAPSPGGPP